MGASPKEVTQMLLDWSKGHQEALDKLMPLVYDELHRVADHYLRSERPDHTLQATALVHEAYLQLVDQRHVRWQNRVHFFGLAAQLMRRVLLEHARSHHAAKRGGGERKFSLSEAAGLSKKRETDLVALDDALTRLAAIDPQQSRIVELRFFGGLTVEEAAEVLDVSPRTVKREWRIAKAWLRRELKK
jgi:RNA polymerase sigma factor (TIGR02999 family)